MSIELSRTSTVNNTPWYTSKLEDCTFRWDESTKSIVIFSKGENGSGTFGFGASRTRYFYKLVIPISEIGKALQEIGKATVDKAIQ